MLKYCPEIEDERTTPRRRRGRGRGKFGLFLLLVRGEFGENVVAKSFGRMTKENLQLSRGS